MLRRHELTDAERDAGGPPLPGRAGDPGRRGADNRPFANAVLFVARTGVPWRDRPGRFGRWNRVWRRYGRWCATGVLGEPDPHELHRDSAAVKARHSAAGSRRRPAETKADAEARRCPGRSRGGWTTKVHAAATLRLRSGRPAGSSGWRRRRGRRAGDAPRAGRLPDGPRPAWVVADAAYDADAIRDRLRRARACVKPNPTRKRRQRHDRARHKHRNVIGRFFGAIKRFRRVATRYDKKAANVLGFGWLAAVLVGL